MTDQTLDPIRRHIDGANHHDAIAVAVTPDDLNRYFSMARMVLGEDDPALDLDLDTPADYEKARRLFAG